MRKLLCVLVPLLLIANLALAQSEADTEVTQDFDDAQFVAPVIVDGETLFMVRGSSALPADERAARVVQRLIDVANASGSAVPTVKVTDTEFGKLILADGQMVTTTTQPDAEFEQVDIDTLAALHAEVIKETILGYRESRSDEARVDSAIAAFGWTIGFLLASYIFVARRKRLLLLLGKQLEKSMVGVEEATKSVLRAKAIVSAVLLAVHVLLWIIFLVFFYYYVSLVLLSFAETQGLANLLLQYISAPLAEVGWAIVGFIPDAIMLIIIFAIARLAFRAINLFFKNIETGVFEIKDFENHWVTPTRLLARTVVVLIGLVFAFPHIPGSDSRAFQGLTILAGIMLSLGSNTVVSNMMAGFFVIYRRSTNIGDRIQVGEKIGDVAEIKLMETVIKSIKNEMISIPNAQLLNSEVVNYSRKVDGRGLLVHTTVGIGYEEPPQKVRAMLIEAANRTSGLKKTPEPFVLWAQLADFAINYEINAYTSRGAHLPKIKSDLHENIVAVFNENKTQIMTPSYMADPAVPKIPVHEWDGKLANSAET